MLFKIFGKENKNIRKCSKCGFEAPGMTWWYDYGIDWIVGTHDQDEPTNYKCPECGNIGESIDK